jgi:hypothetical protein
VANEVKSPEEIRLLLHRKQAIIDVRFRRDVRRPVVFGGSVAFLLMWKPLPSANFRFSFARTPHKSGRYHGRSDSLRLISLEVLGILYAGIISGASGPRGSRSKGRRWIPHSITHADKRHSPLRGAGSRSSWTTALLSRSISRSNTPVRLRAYSQVTHVRAVLSLKRRLMSDIPLSPCIRPSQCLAQDPGQHTAL